MFQFIKYDTYEEFSKKYDVVTQSKIINLTFSSKKTAHGYILFYRNERFTGITYAPSRVVYPYETGNKPIFWFYENGIIHRLTGPAKLGYNTALKNTGPLVAEWFVNGIQVIPDELLDFYDKNGMDIDNLTPEDEYLITERFGRK